MGIKQYTELTKILHADGRERNVKIALQKEMRKMKPFQKRYAGNKDIVKQEDIENVVRAMCCKYHVTIQWLTCHVEHKTGEMWWSISLKTDNNHKFIGSLTDATMYGILSKTAVYIHALIKEQIEYCDEHNNRIYIAERL